MRYAVGIEYNGANYSGWQKQYTPGVIGVEHKVEQALSLVANSQLELTCAGRTDAGVHATGQVVHFDSPVERLEKSWVLGANSNLPDDIAIKWAKPVSPDFDARYSATARRYRYIIYNRRERPAILRSGLTQFYEPLDHHLMHQAAQLFLGEQDFSAFRSSSCESKTPFRHVSHCWVNRYGDYLVVDIQANAFLHHMVRNIVGALLVIGCAEKPVSWISELLAGKDRTLAAATAKPNGLYLVRVFYPDELNIPQVPMGPLFFADN
ncbi:tRNA pseudouridine(38-40) synthase TruA [Saccharobesus litoralis]|uniref:tRNA pseudouridine synthase A n=1 Tax=Saccharobesus litoralis TaxID=2172099 RepID=A0A2S0VTB9_9ALTE|nr:tRNA pseudouridine(38-40) synthase TruA [Saccharobesus litoralis]AWB67454.1 tRNA pseudouridine(38-40) synthase TruA [Saccharobesus litoralis]